MAEWICPDCNSLNRDTDQACVVCAGRGPQSTPGASASYSVPGYSVPGHSVPGQNVGFGGSEVSGQSYSVQGFSGPFGAPAFESPPYQPEPYQPEPQQPQPFETPPAGAPEYGQPQSDPAGWGQPQQDPGAWGYPQQPDPAAYGTPVSGPGEYPGADYPPQSGYAPQPGYENQWPAYPPTSGGPPIIAPHAQRPRRTGLLVAALVAVLVLGAAYPVTTWLVNRTATGQGGSANQSLGNQGGGSGAASTPTQTPTPGPTPTTDATGTPTQWPTSVALVQINASPNGPTVVSVARTLDTYFSAINARDYQRALSMYDPSGVVNPNDPAKAQAFTQAVSTTRDSQIELHSVAAEPSIAGAVLAEVSFQSEQAAGFGPKGRENELCTRWSLTYILTSPAPDTYRILRASRADSRPC